MLESGEASFEASLRLIPYICAVDFRFDRSHETTCGYRSVGWRGPDDLLFAMDAADAGWRNLGI